MFFTALICIAMEQCFAAGGVTTISVNGLNGAWIGYDNGHVRFCTGGGGTAVPYWTTCTTAIEPDGSAITDISNRERRAWIGSVTGRLHYCKESGGRRQPIVECTEVKP